MGKAEEPIIDTRGSYGGRRGWIAVLAYWTRNVVVMGVTKGLGVMLPTLEQQLSTQTWVVGWITSLVIAIGGFSAIFAKAAGSRFGAGYVIMMCAAMIGSAFIAGSFVQTPLQLAWVLVPLVGAGFEVSNVIAKEALALLFSENYATANGIARTGYSVGLLAYAPLVQLFLNTYGWRGTMLLIGAITMHLVVCGALMVTTSKANRLSVVKYQNVPADENQSPNSARQEFNCGAWSSKEIFAKFDVGLLVDSRFWALTSILSLTSFTFDMWVIYFVSQGLDNGFSTQEVGTFVAVAGVASLIAKILQGVMTDRGMISSSSLSAIFILTAAASYCLTPWQTSYWPMMTLSCVAIFSDGVLCCQGDVLIKQAIGSELVGATFAWNEVTYATITLTFGFLPGWLYDTTGNFITSFMFIGLVQGVTILPLIYLWFYGHVK